MKTLYYVPIEPLAERYTEQWYRNFPIEFREQGFDVVTIDGDPLSNFVGVGTFLDINSTIHYKNSQFMQITKLFAERKIKNNDVFFFGDTEFWGIESLRLLSQMNNVKVKIYSFLHAASYTKEDAIEVAAPYQKYTELGWIASMDAVFVGSEYHKQAVIDRRIRPFAAPEDVETLSNKIINTGNPIFPNEYKSFLQAKKKQIIISNRFDWEKRPNISLDFAYILKRKHPDWNIVVSTSRPEFKSNKSWLVDMARAMEKDGIIEIYSGLSKDEYHRLLSESKIMLSNSIEENFGYCIVEALMYNTYPLLFNGLSHPEIVENHPRLLFNDEDEIIEKAEFLMGAVFNVSSLATKYTTSLTQMAGVMYYD